MKKKIKALLLTLSLLSLPAAAEPIGASVSVGFDSDYIFRGVKFSEQLGWFGVDYGYQGLSTGIWYASSFDDDYDEFNFFAAYSREFGPVTVGVGYTYYLFPFADDADAHEVGASVSTTVGLIDLGVNYYYDFEAEGSYIDTTAGSTYKINDYVSISGEALLSYNYDYYIDGHDFNHAQGTVSLPIALSETAELAPYVSYVYPLDAIDLTEDDTFYAGVSLSVTF